MPKLTAAVLACNNQDDIGACLQSVEGADELLVILDDRSCDRTRAIAESLGARVVPHPFEGFARQRNFGLSVATGDWLFYIDTDERATPELMRELRRVIDADECYGWWVPRHNIIWGREIRYGGWFPDYQLRLLKLGHAQYDPRREVHEVVELDGKEGYLENPLTHYNYRSVGQFVRKQRQYADLQATISFREGIRPKPWTYLSQPLREFRRRYLTLRGYKDGLHGLGLCALVAYYYGFVVTLKVGLLVRQSRARPLNNPPSQPR